LAFAHDDVIHSVCFEALVVRDEGEDEVFLGFGVDEVAVCGVVPGYGFDVVDVEVYYLWLVVRWCDVWKIER
jgi:hypothetical protein